MKLIIAGGRDFNDYPLLENEIKKFIIESIDNTKPIPQITIISGKAAGPIRNEEMAKIATHCICFFNGSRGTANMIENAKKYNLILKIINY